MKELLSRWLGLRCAAKMCPCYSAGAVDTEDGRPVSAFVCDDCGEVRGAFYTFSSARPQKSRIRLLGARAAEHHAVRRSR